MRLVVILLLLCFWLYAAFVVLQRGNVAMAGLLALIGVALTVYRLRRAKNN